MPVFLKKWWGYRRIAEPWVAIDVGRCATGHVTVAGLNPIVKALLGGLRIGRGR